MLTNNNQSNTVRELAEVYSYLNMLIWQNNMGFLHKILCDNPPEICHLYFSTAILRYMYTVKHKIAEDKWYEYRDAINVTLSQEEAELVLRGLY